MGQSISWLAVQASPEEARNALALCATGETVEIPEAPLVGAELSGGWYLVIAQGCDHALVGDDFVSSISRERDAVACSIEEHVMWSSASFWTGGASLWSVVHDAQESIDHFTVDGTPPQSFIEVKDRLLEQQKSEGGADADVDFVFDLPLELAEEIVGFRHDGAAGCYPDAFEVLHPADSGSPLVKKPWWKFW
jgi:hypothetical protein